MKANKKQFIKEVKGNAVSRRSKMLDAAYEVEFFNINELEDVNTGAKEPVYDVDINNPIHGRYNMAKVTEQEYGTSRYYLLMTPYTIEAPEPPTLPTLLAHLLLIGALPQEHKSDVYRVTATGETMTVGEGLMCLSE